MSAEANLAGLYPPEGNQIWNENLKWQPIPVHSNEHKLIFPERDDCPKYKKEFKKVKKNDYFKNINKKYTDLLDAISKYSGTTYDDIKGVREVRDNIYVYESYNKSYIPSWASKLDRKTLDYVTGIYFERRTYTDNLKKFLTGPFFQKLTIIFDEAISDKTPRKLYMVSSHESALVPVLDALQAYDFFPPDFAATIIFELRKIGTEHFVQIYYKQFTGIKLLSVAECGSSCDYHKFKKFVGKYAMTYEEWQKECGKDDDDH